MSPPRPISVRRGLWSLVLPKSRLSHFRVWASVNLYFGTRNRLLSVVDRLYRDQGASVEFHLKRDVDLLYSLGVSHTSSCLLSGFTISSQNHPSLGLETETTETDRRRLQGRVENYVLGGSTDLQVSFSRDSLVHSVGSETPSSGVDPVPVPRVETDYPYWSPFGDSILRRPSKY